MPRRSGAMLRSATAETAVLNGFGDVRGAYFRTVGEVGDGPGNLENAVPGPGREVELQAGFGEQAPAVGVCDAMRINFGRAEAGVGFILPGHLARQRGFDPAAHRRRTFAVSLFCQSLGGQCRYFNEQVKAIEERAG